jgi:ATP-dependent RNA helicase SUPV3L1/SUV3
MSVVKELCDYLGEELTVKTFKRKNPLHVLEKPISIERIRPHSAIITFSRYEVLSLKEKLSSRYSVSVIYGNLSPEVRREEAKRFREGESSILIATDAISMGLNLPIESIIFAKSSKFDGFQTRELKPIEVVQIAGRAGRYGLHEEGFIGALDRETLKSISDKLRQNPKQITPPLRVKATLEHIMLIGEIIRSDSLFEILKFFSKNMEFEGPFIAGNIKSMLVLAGIVDMYSLDLRTKYIFASSPVTLHSNHLETVFHQYLVQFQNGENIPFKSLKTLPLFAKTQEELLEKEDRVKEVSLYLWLSFKFPDRFRDVDRAEDARRALNLFIESSLKRGELKKMCRVCKKRLDFSYRYNICEVCFYAGGYF